MKANIAAIVALSSAALFAASPAQAQIASLDFGNAGGGAPSQAAASVASPVAPSSPSSTPATARSTSVAVSAITAPSGSDAPATSTIASSPIASPAYAAGTVTYVPEPLPTSASRIDVSSLPSSVPAIASTASSNFTLPNATATATFASIPTLRSSPYQIVFANTDGLPMINYNLAMNNSEQVKTALCASQMQFCSTAGCNVTDAKLTNFCETKYMGVACSCSKGASRLEQYQWPVMLADCQGRNIACRDACVKPGQSVQSQNNCLDTCTQNYGSTCAKPGQYAANYAVTKEGSKPSYAIVQGGTAQNAAMKLGGGMVIVVAVAGAVSALVMGV